MRLTHSADGASLTMLWAILVLELADVTHGMASTWWRSSVTLSTAECEALCIPAGVAAYGMDRCECAVEEAAPR